MSWHFTNSHYMIIKCFGIDVSKNTLDIAFYDGGDIRKDQHKKVSNDTDGFDLMLQCYSLFHSSSE